MSTPTPSLFSPGPPSQAEMLALLFWASRWLVGGSAFHRGGLSVEICAGRGRKSLTLRPGEGDERYGPADGPGCGGLNVAALLALMFCEDEMTIIQAVTERSALNGAEVVKTSGLDRGRCYELLRSLKERGVLRDGADGIELTCPEVWRACRGQSSR